MCVYVCASHRVASSIVAFCATSFCVSDTTVASSCTAERIASVQARPAMIPKHNSSMALRRRHTHLRATCVRGMRSQTCNQRMHWQGAKATVACTCSDACIVML